MATTSTSQSVAEPTATISAFAASLREGLPARFGSLTLVPLFGDGGELALVGLEEGLRAGQVTVTEVTESGDVNCLRVTNTGGTPVLLFDGEELVGARQDRIVNTSILVPGAGSIDIPVSCVEQGRWRYRTARFAAGSVLTHEMRRSKVMRVTMNLRRTGTYDADQGAVWEEVAEYAERRGARSATGAYADVVAQDRARIEEYVAALPCASGQAGLAAYIGGELIGADVLGSAALYAALHAVVTAILRHLGLPATPRPAAPPRGPPEPDPEPDVAAWSDDLFADPPAPD